MKRLFYIIKKEISDIKSNVAFFIIVVVMPLVYLSFWVLTVSKDVSFPVSLQNTDVDTSFAEHLLNYATPDGVKYFYSVEGGKENIEMISIKEPIAFNNGEIVGRLELNLGSIDLNMTKNYQNRLTGATNSYIEKNFLANKAIKINEYKTNKRDVSWANYFTASLLGMGMLMAGLLFAALSMTSEWKSGTIIFLFTSAQNPSWILIGKEIAFLLKGFMATAIFLLVAKIISPFSFDYLGLFASVFLGYWFIGLIGLIIGILIKEPIVSFLIALLASVSFWILGNGFGGMEFLLGSFGQIMVLLNPIAYLIALLQYFINGAATNWLLDMLVLIGGIVLLQIVSYLLYRQKVYLPRQQKS